MENIKSRLFLLCYILYILDTCVTEKVKNDQSKRLLLDDPDVLTRLAQLEQKFTILNQKQDQIISTLQGQFLI